MRQASWRRGETPTCVCLFNTDLIMQNITYEKQTHLHLTVVHTGQRHVLHFHLQKPQEKALLSTCCSAAVMGWGEAETTTTTQTKEDTGRAWDSNIWFRLHLNSQTKRKPWPCSSAFACDIKNNRIYQRYTLLYKATARGTNDTSLHCLE